MMLADHWGTLKPIMWNVKGSNHLNKGREILTFIKSKKVAIPLFQQTHLLPTLSEKVWVGRFCFFFCFV